MTTEIGARDDKKGGAKENKKKLEYAFNKKRDASSCFTVLFLLLLHRRWLSLARTPKRLRVLCS